MKKRVCVFFIRGVFFMCVFKVFKSKQNVVVLKRGFSFIRAASLKRGVLFKRRASFQKVGFLSKGWFSFFSKGAFFQSFFFSKGFFSKVSYFHIVLFLDLFFQMFLSLTFIFQCFFSRFVFLFLIGFPKNFSKVFFRGFLFKGFFFQMFFFFFQRAFFSYGLCSQEGFYSLKFFFLLMVLGMLIVKCVRCLCEPCGSAQSHR